MNEEQEKIPESIGRALFALMAEKHFEEISVSELCQEAGVGRTTYYRYFSSGNGKKEALRCCLYGAFGRRLSKHSDAEGRDRAFLSEIYEKKENLRLLKRDGMMDVIDDLVLKFYGPSEADDPSAYYLGYAGAGIWIGIVRSILGRDFQDEPSAVLAGIAAGLYAQAQRQKKTV
ncbi:MAG: TetR/AcrR family transcriptional regulator [Bulleidia sp.]